MNRRYTCVLLGVLAASSGALSGQTTDEALNSPRVRNVLVVSREGERLVVCADVLFSDLLNRRDGSCRTALDSPLRYVASGREIQVAWAGFNPLLVNVSGTLTTTPDPAAAVLANLADAIGKLGKSLAGMQESAPARDNERFLEAIKRYQELLAAPVVVSSDVEAWKTLASGRTGIERAREKIKDASDGLSAHFKAVENALEE